MRLPTGFAMTCHMSGSEAGAGGASVPLAFLLAVVLVFRFDCNLLLFISELNIGQNEPNICLLYRMKRQTNVTRMSKKYRGKHEEHT